MFLKEKNKTKIENLKGLISSKAVQQKKNHTVFIGMPNSNHERGVHKNGFKWFCKQSKTTPMLGNWFGKFEMARCETLSNPSQTQGERTS